MDEILHRIINTFVSLLAVFQNTNKRMMSLSIPFSENLMNPSKDDQVEVIFTAEAFIIC
jgi:hypothetical protein